MSSNKDGLSGPSAPLSSAASGFAGRAPAYLGASLQIKGDITGNEDLRLDSKVEGSISIGGFRLTVGQSSRVEGDIVAREVFVQGHISGNISARDRLELKNGSSVTGDLSTARIMIEDGAYFKGAVEIDRSHTQVGADLDTLLGNSR